MYQFLSFQLLLREPIPPDEKHTIIANFFEATISTGLFCYKWNEQKTEMLIKDDHAHTLACFKMNLCSGLDSSPIISILMDRLAVLRFRYKNDVQLHHLVLLNASPLLVDAPNFPPGLTRIKEDGFPRTYLTRSPSAELPVLFEEDEPKYFESHTFAVWQPLTQPILKKFADPFAEAAVKTSLKNGVKRATNCILERDIKPLMDKGIQAGLTVGREVGSHEVGKQSLLEVSVQATVEAIIKCSIETVVKIAVENGAKSFLEHGLDSGKISDTAVKAVLEADFKSAIETGLAEASRKQGTFSGSGLALIKDVQINDFRSSPEFCSGRRSRGRVSRRTPSPLASETF